MKTSRYTEAQIIAILRQAEGGVPVATSAEKQGVATLHIQPGQPQQNAYIQRYNRTVRHEWLDQYIIESIEEAQDFATQWLWTCNTDRPTMGIGGITTAQKLKMAA